MTMPYADFDRDCSLADLLKMKFHTRRNVLSPHNVTSLYYKDYRTPLLFCIIGICRATRLSIIFISSPYDMVRMNNLKRDPLEIQHPKFENSRLGLIKTVHER